MAVMDFVYCFIVRPVWAGHSSCK